jgi:hypothetical protein
MLTQPGAVQAPPAQPSALANQVPQVQFGDRIQTVNAPADANKLPAGNAKDAVEAVWAGANPNLEKDDNAARVGEIAKNTLFDAATGLVKDGVPGLIEEGSRTLLKEGGGLLAEKYIQDLKENKLLPKLEANYPAGILDAIAVWAGVGKSGQGNQYLDRAGNIYAASYRTGENLLGNLAPEAAGNLKAVMQDAGKRMEFEKMISEKINVELSARASQILK